MPAMLERAKAQAANLEKQITKSQALTKADQCAPTHTFCQANQADSRQGNRWRSASATNRGKKSGFSLGNANFSH